MTFSQIMFSFNGRLARLPFFGYSVLAAISVVVLAIAARVFFAAFPPILMTVANLLAVAIMGGGIWAGLALATKRLHDLGFSGLHLIWMYGIQFVFGFISSAANLGITFDPSVVILAFIGNIGSVAIWLLILLAPGNPQKNKYGPVPGTAPLMPAPRPVA